jgi:hypothetical protein
VKISKKERNWELWRTPTDWVEAKPTRGFLVGEWCDVMTKWEKNEKRKKEQNLNDSRSPIVEF